MWQVQEALRSLDCLSCPVFLMTNCRDGETLAALADELPTMVTYAPWSQEFAEEGPRLVIEQAREAPDLGGASQGSGACGVLS